MGQVDAGAYHRGEGGVIAVGGAGGWGMWTLERVIKAYQAGVGNSRGRAECAVLGLQLGYSQATVLQLG